MKRLHGMVLRRLPGPFFGWLGTLLFLLLMQFLIEKLPDLAGKGLSLALIAEVIVYSLAYMIVLAVPMSVLLATLMAFGGLVESKAFAAAKGAGISLVQLVWPVLVLGLLVSGGMVYFNNVVLPEANFRQKNLWRDIRVKKPGFALQEGIFYEELDDHALLVEEIPPDSSGLLRDVTIYDYTGGARQQTTIKAQRGRLRSKAGGARIHLTLFDGEIHRRSRGSGRYERLRFQTHELTLKVPGTRFERDTLRKDYRSDRTTPTLQMIRHVDSLEATLAKERHAARRLNRSLWAPPPDTAAPAQPPTDTAGSEPPSRLPPEAARRGATPRPPTRVAASRQEEGRRGRADAPSPEAGARRDTLGPRPARYATQGLSEREARETYRRAARSARQVRSELSNMERELVWTNRKAANYRVEIYKKSSMAVACFLFVLIGVPLGLSLRGGSLGTAAAVALGIFIFYWVTLGLGEKAADRGALPPWLGMWIANAVLAVAGAWLMAYVALDLHATPPLRRRLWQWVKREKVEG
jgi:lipopolysaccharide export system permease protein